MTGFSLLGGRHIKAGDDMIYKFVTGAGAKEFNDTERSFVAWASKSSMDRQDEEIDASGWDTANFEKNPVVPLFHDYEKFPIARAAWVKKSPRSNPEGLLFKPIFAKTEIGEEAFYLYKEGFMNAFSVGFDPIEWQDGDGKTYSKAIDGEFGVWEKAYIQKARKKPRCKYLKQELLEISGVVVPAHPDALIDARGFVKTKELSEYLDILINESKPNETEIKLIELANEVYQLKQDYALLKQEYNASEYTGDDIEIDLDNIEVEVDTLDAEGDTLEVLVGVGDVQVELETEIQVEI